jgi:Xaa-Pro aminopeptidase
MRYLERISKASEVLHVQEIDALLITRDIHVQFLSGFLGSNGSVLVHQNQVHLFTDSRYITAAKLESPHCEIHIVKDVIADAIEFACKLECKKIGVESDWISAATFKEIEDVDRLTIVLTQNIIEDLRLIKEPEEIAAIEMACDITSVSWWQLLEEGLEGKSEFELTVRLEQLFRINGAQDRAFETILATGPNSAIPHHHPTSRVVQKGDFLKIDCGAKYLGYHADMTRTIVIGKAESWQREIYEVVSKSQSYGKELCKPGEDVFPINDQLYSVIRNAGYGQNILHASGHGVGLEIHERPFLGRRDGILAACMPITVEPGIYIEGKGGVRIEDTIEVVDNGYRDLTKATREFIEW